MHNIFETKGATLLNFSRISHIYSQTFNNDELEPSLFGNKPKTINEKNTILKNIDNDITFSQNQQKSSTINNTQIKTKINNIFNNTNKDEFNMLYNYTCDNHDELLRK